MARQSERGNVLGFVLVGAFLTALLLGGIYLVRQSSSDSTPTDVSVNNDHKETPKGANKNDGQDSSTAKDRALKKALEDKSKTTTDPPVTNHDSQDTQDGATPPVPPTTPNTQAGQTSRLPSTGPAETLFSTLGVATLAGAGIAYIRSRSLL